MFTNENSEPQEFNFTFNAGALLNDQFKEDLLNKKAKENEEKQPSKTRTANDNLADKEEDLPITEEEIDKENPNKKTPLKPKNMTPKQPFKVIYASSQTTEFNLSEASESQDFNRRD